MRSMSARRVGAILLRRRAATVRDTRGELRDYSGLAERLHEHGALLIAACDPLALTVLRPPGEFGADIAVGTMQRFGTPMGYGGPHAAYLACKKGLIRRMPGRLVGTALDSRGHGAYRLALQTREQHIRKEKATSNVCTAQALLASVNAMYAAWHGPEGLSAIAERVTALSHDFARKASALPGWHVDTAEFFDTVVLRPPCDTRAATVASYVSRRGANLRVLDNGLGVTFDETHASSDVDEIVALLELFVSKNGERESSPRPDLPRPDLPPELRRTTPFLQQEAFHEHRTEVQMTRFLRRLGGQDLGLEKSMIPLGSCTMKLNPVSTMTSLCWPEFADIHPFAPDEQVGGYREIIGDLSRALSQITGLDACTLQPNSGATGELAGLQAIKGYLSSIGEGHRDVCLVPESAHGTNLASAALAGLRVVRIKNGRDGEICSKDLTRRIDEHGPRLACLMMTFPSTHGVFEKHATSVCEKVHAAGGQVYLDGANMNALIGVSSAFAIGADACHLNLHKTFAIPHGGGGPGMGPVCAARHLEPFLPGHCEDVGESSAGHKGGQVAAAPFGSAMILPISWAYIHLLGWDGLQSVAKAAILSANYMKSRLEGRYTVKFLKRGERCAHEFILDVSEFSAIGVSEIDVAKRLMDFGFHAPTMSWPVKKSLMIEPTESEDKAELDRYCDALLTIREEIAKIASGEWPRDRNPLTLAPHTLDDIVDANWDRPYTRETAAFPLPWVRERGKFWPTVNRVDDARADGRELGGCG
eukprot:Polyplicarium_translucidae@DN2555_c0_g1_i1.p1